MRPLGTFKELLEPGGAILYRNLFREDQVSEAWRLLTLLRPWHEKLTCYLGGEVQPLKNVNDVLWCAAFLAKDRPCRAGEGKKDRPAGCLGARVLLGPGSWDLSEPQRRHALTFSSVDEEGVLCFDADAIAAFVAQGRNLLCPASPARDPEAFAAAFHPCPVRDLGWPLVAELSASLRKKLAKALDQELGFFLGDGVPELEAHAHLELAWEDEAVVVRHAGTSGPSLADGVRVPAAVRKVLQGGTLLRGVRMQEAYVRRKGGHFDVEQRFVLSTRVNLLAVDRAARFRGYRLTTYPRSTPEYADWVERVREALP